MTRTTKIILLSTGGLILGVGAFLGVRYIIRSRKKKRQEEQARLLANMPSTPPPSSTGSSTVPSGTGTSTGSSTTPSGTGSSTVPSSTGSGTAPAGTSGTTNVVTSSGVPVVMASYTTLDPTTPATPTYNANSVTFKKLDLKIKSLYRMLNVLDRKDGKTIFIETDDFKPERPNSEVGLSTQQIVWREVYNNMMDVLKGFNNEEKDNPTKSYGLLLLDIFKKQRLDFLFPPKLADGKDSVFSPSAKWYKDAEKQTIANNLKTDFWKTN
jgi:hypothetical protein